MPRRTSCALRVFAACLAVFCFGASPTAHAQRISVQADDYQQAFEGVGSSIPLYLNNHFNGTDSLGRRQALDLIVRRNNLLCLQDYPEFRLDDPRAQNGYYARRVEYLRAAKAIRPELLLSQTFSIFPDDLRKDTTVDGKNERRLDFRRAGIYDEVAQWYFETLKFYNDNGLPIDVVNLVNEPDFIVWRYGYDRDARRGTAELFTQGVDKLRALIDGANAAGDSIPQPRIMGPSTIGPGGAVGFLNYYKDEYPAAWDNIDIVSYHQYTNGVGSALQTVTRLAEGKPVWQSEMHTNRGDNLGNLPLTRGHRGILSLAQLMTESLNAGANAWFYFLNVFPGEDTNPGLLQIDNTVARPVPFRHYYAFRQIGSAQPAGARVVTRRLASIRSDGDVLALREEGSDTVYVHYANYTGGERVVELEIVDAGGGAYPIRSYAQRVSDADSDDEDLGFRDAERADAVTVTAGPYSLNTFTVAIGGTSGLSPKPAPAPFRAYADGDAVTVQLDEGFEPEAVRLADVSGRVLRQAHLAVGQRTARLPAGGLAPGVYLVSARTARGWATVRVLWQ